jgi:hypothetical protein
MEDVKEEIEVHPHNPNLKKMILTHIPSNIRVEDIINNTEECRANLTRALIKRIETGNYKSVIEKVYNNG